MRSGRLAGTALAALLMINPTRAGEGAPAAEGDAGSCDASTGDAAACSAAGGADSARLTDALLAWATENGAVGMRDLELRHFNKSGVQVRGIASTRKLERGETAFTIPERLVLTKHHPDVAASPFRELTSDFKQFEMPFSVLLFLAAERRRVADGGESFWAPWIRVLSTPQEFAMYHPFYASSDLLEAFRGVPVVAGIERAQHFVQETWDKHHQRWRELAAEFGVPNIDFDDFKWAVVQAKSRSFDIAWGYHGYTKQSPGFAMVPVADLPNHADNNNLRWFKELKGTPIVWEVKTENSVKRGRELTLNYGQDANDELFLHYGFVEARNNNQMKPLKEKNRVLCKPKRLARLMQLESAEQGPIAAGLKSLLTELCAALPPKNRPAPPPAR